MSPRISPHTNFISNKCIVVCIGGHSVRYQWSAISDWAWYRNVLYQTEERRVWHHVRYRNKLFCLISNILQLKFINPRSAVVRRLLLDIKIVGLKPVRKIMSHRILIRSYMNKLSILDIGISDIDLVRYRNGSWCRYRNSSEIGMKGFSPTYFVPILE